MVVDGQEHAAVAIEGHAHHPPEQAVVHEKSEAANLAVAVLDAESRGEAVKLQCLAVFLEPHEFHLGELFFLVAFERVDFSC